MVDWHRDYTRDVNKARGVKAKVRDMQAQGHRFKAKTKAKVKNVNVNCRENAIVSLSILSHFRYFLEKLQ